MELDGDGLIPTYQPPLEALSQPGDIGSVCEIGHYERVKNSKGKVLLLRVGSTRARALQMLRDERSSRSALILIKEPNPSDEKNPKITLEIQSPHMKMAIKSCIPEFENTDIEQKSIVIADEPRCIFHYRQELIKYHQRCAQNNNGEAATHVGFLLNYMFHQLASQILHFDQYMKNPLLQPALDFPNLWMAFTPGDLIHVRHLSSSSAPWDYVFRFHSMTRCRCSKPWCSDYDWKLKGFYIDYDGDNFGHLVHHVALPAYEGVKALRDLRATPLKFHPDKASLEEKFIARGKRFVGLSGYHFKHCRGPARLFQDTRVDSLVGEEDRFSHRLTHVSSNHPDVVITLSLKLFQINSRVIVDCKMFSEVKPTHQPDLLMSQKCYRTESGQHLRMTDEEYMICDNNVAGYSLQHHKWGWFSVDTIREIEFDDDAFNCLIIQPTFKELMLSLVKSHSEEASTFDDFIAGKGRGLIFLLHGEPGTGKTLTAGTYAFIHSTLATRTNE